MIFDDDVPCLTCGKKIIINLNCDNHCIVLNCKTHFPTTNIIKGNGKND